MIKNSQFHLTEWSLHQDAHTDEFFVVLSGYDEEYEEHTHFAITGKELAPMIEAYKKYLIQYGDPNQFIIDLSTHQILDRIQGTSFHIWKDDSVNIKWFQCMEADDFFPHDEYNDFLEREEEEEEEETINKLEQQAEDGYLDYADALRYFHTGDNTNEYISKLHDEYMEEVVGHCKSCGVELTREHQTANDKDGALFQCKYRHLTALTHEDIQKFLETIITFTVIQYNLPDNNIEIIYEDGAEDTIQVDEDIEQAFREALNEPDSSYDQLMNEILFSTFASHISDTHGTNKFDVLSVVHKVDNPQGEIQ